MREILFRGARIDTKEWIQGGICFRQDDKPCIVYTMKDPETNNIYVSAIDVDPESVGQFTGRTDKNGVKLFEGDIVQVRTCWFPPEDSEDLSLDQIDEIFFNEEIPKGYDREIIKFPENHYYRYYKNYQVVWSKKREHFELKNDKDIEPFYDGQSFTIIGNVFDNPGFLKDS